MAIHLNHHIVYVKDKQASAEYYADVFGLPPVFARLKAYNTTYYSDPFLTHPGEFNTDDGGRGVYWFDPDRHFLEIITKPYGGIGA